MYKCRGLSLLYADISHSTVGEILSRGIDWGATLFQKTLSVQFHYRSLITTSFNVMDILWPGGLVFLTLSWSEH